MDSNCKIELQAIPLLTADEAADGAGVMSGVPTEALAAQIREINELNARKRKAKR